MRGQHEAVWTAAVVAVLAAAAWRQWGRRGAAGSLLALSALVWGIGHPAARLRQLRADRQLDEAGKESFPASDAPAVH